MSEERSIEQGGVVAVELSERQKSNSGNTQSRIPRRGKRLPESGVRIHWQCSSEVRWSAPKDQSSCASDGRWGLCHFSPRTAWHLCRADCGRSENSEMPAMRGDRIPTRVTRL